jgi:ubiquitin carboxyl-terminal hydrolase 10
MNNMYNYQYWPNQQYYGSPNQQVMPVSGYPPYQSYAQSPPPTSQAGFSGIAYGTSPSQPSPALATPYQPPPSASYPNGPPSTYSPQVASSRADTTTQQSETTGATSDAAPSTSDEEPLIIWGFDPLQQVTLQLPTGRDRMYPMVVSTP